MKSQTQDATSKKTPATKTPPITFHTGERLKGRKSTTPAPVARKKTAEEKRHEKRTAEFMKRSGRNYSIGKVSESGRILWVCFDELTLDEADAIVEGTDLNIIACGDAGSRYKWRKPVYKLARKLFDYRDKVLELRWPDGSRSKEEPLPASRDLDLWILVHASERLGRRIASVTANEQEAGRAIDRWAYHGIEVYGYRVTVKVPTETSTPMLYRVLDADHCVLFESASIENAWAFCEGRGSGKVVRVQHDGSTSPVRRKIIAKPAR